MARTFGFDILCPETEARVARVLYYIRRLADPYHGEGGCSAFQIAFELTRCLIASYAFSLKGRTPSLGTMTNFATSCYRVVRVNKRGRFPNETRLTPPSQECWRTFFFLLTRICCPYRAPGIACESSPLLVGKIYYIGPEIAKARTEAEIPAFAQLCETFARRQLQALVERVHLEPKMLTQSIIPPPDDPYPARTAIYKPTESAADCVMKVVGYLVQNLRLQNINVCPTVISNTFTKVLGTCALWNGLVVSSRFTTAFERMFLPQLSADDVQSLASNSLSIDVGAASTFIRLVHYYAVIWQPSNPRDEQLFQPAQELLEIGESIALEHVLDTLLKSFFFQDMISPKIIAPIIMRNLPALPDPCLTSQECHRVLFRHETFPDLVLNGTNAILNPLTLAGAPPWNVNPPTCLLTPAEILCYFPNTLCIPQIWKWIWGHGWTKFNIPTYVNKARELKGIYALDSRTVSLLQRKAQTAYRKDNSLQIPPHTPTLNIAPYVQFYHDTRTPRHKRTMVDISLARVVLSVKCHPTGDDRGRFTMYAQHAATTGTERGRVFVNRIVGEANASDEDQEGVSMGSDMNRDIRGKRKRGEDEHGGPESGGKRQRC